MQESLWDFAVLGDSQVEGLLLAAALAKRGYRVGLVPSSNMGELPLDVASQVELPEGFGSQRLDDFLFQAGFFQLEESGLRKLEQKRQFILPKHRLTFSSEPQCWDAEIQREFPLVAEILVRARRVASKEPKNNFGLSERLIREAVSKSPAAREFFSLDGAWQTEGWNPEFDLKSLIQAWASKSRHVFKVDPSIALPYQEFLQEHARKFGVQLRPESIQIKKKVFGFELAKDLKAKRLILNSLAAIRMLSRDYPELYQQNISSWLFVRSWTLPLALIPEPLEEKVLIHPSQGFDFVLRCFRDRSRSTAEVNFGVWLDFTDTKNWLSTIKETEEAILKLFPYWSESQVRKELSLFELTEMKGECVRRGDIRRLSFEKSRLSSWGRVSRRIKSGLRARPENDLFIHPRIFAPIASSRPVHDSQFSLMACLRYLDGFPRQTKSSSAA